MTGSRHFLLRSSETSDWIEFTSLDELSDWSFDIRAFFRGYAVKETSVTLRDLSTFANDLVTFERTRKGKACISGTYDFEFAVEAFERRGSALVTFSLTNLLHLPNNKYGRCLLEAAFVVNGEYVASMCRGLAALAAPIN